jgi:hypothetical protein
MSTFVAGCTSGSTCEITLNTGSSGVPMEPMSKCFARRGKKWSPGRCTSVQNQDLRRYLGEQNHPERIYQEFIEAHRGDVMLNAGLLGGTRADVMAFAHGIIRLYYRIESYRFWKKEQAGAAVGDMMAFGIVAQSFSDRLVTGPLVHTVFKTDGFGRENAWWKHK